MACLLGTVHGLCRAYFDTRACALAAWTAGPGGSHWLNAQGPLLACAAADWLVVDLCLCATLRSSTVLLQGPSSTRRRPFKEGLRAESIKEENFVAASRDWLRRPATTSFVLNPSTGDVGGGWRWLVFVE